MQGVAVRLRIDGYGPDAELLASAEDAQGDFAAVGNQDFSEHWISSRCRRQCCRWCEALTGRHDSGTGGRTEALLFALRADREQRLAVFDGMAVLDKDT